MKLGAHLETIPMSKNKQRQKFLKENFIGPTKNKVKDEFKAKLACSYNNLSKKRKSIGGSKTQRNYCHKNTDKRDASVILDVKNYIIESERQLSNTEDHINLEHDSTTENHTAIKKL